HWQVSPQNSTSRIRGADNKAVQHLAHPGDQAKPADPPRKESRPSHRERAEEDEHSLWSEQQHDKPVGRRVQGYDSRRAATGSRHLSSACRNRLPRHLQDDARHHRTKSKVSHRVLGPRTSKGETKARRKSDPSKQGQAQPPRQECNAEVMAGVAGDNGISVGPAKTRATRGDCAGRRNAYKFE